MRKTFTTPISYTDRSGHVSEKDRSGHVSEKDRSGHVSERDRGGDAERPVLTPRPTAQALYISMCLTQRAGWIALLRPTHFGFRRKKGTHNALHCTRRVITFGEGTNNPVFLVLLDWEKAFDKIPHDILFKCLDRMGVPEQIIASCRKLYANPGFKVNVGGLYSHYYSQRTGIRQGPMSSRCRIT